MKRIAIVCAVLVASLVVVHEANANFIVRPSQIRALSNDSRITAVTASAASPALGATTTWMVTFTTNTALTPPDMGARFDLRASCWEDGCRPSLSGATFSGIANVQFEVDPSGGVNIQPLAALPAGTYTITATNVVNPSRSTVVKASMMSRGPGDPEPQPNQPMPETLSNAVLIGTIVVQGTVVSFDGTTPVQNVGVNLRSQDFSFHANAGTDAVGYFAIGAPAGQTMPTGTLFVEAFPPPQTPGIVAPDPVQINYQGSTVNVGTIAFRQATKTLNVTVVYNTGGAVTTANIWANKPEGGFGAGAETNASGLATIMLSGGIYNVGVGPKWDQQNNRQMDVDWTYDQPPTTVEFANNATPETKAMTVTVTKTNATMRGRIVKPNGTPAANIGIGCHSGFGGGPGRQTDQNGVFSMGIVAGDWDCEVWTDPNNPEFARLSSPQLHASVAVGQTYDFGTITLVERGGRISGRVTTSAGTAVANLEMNAWREGQGGGGWTNARTDASGNYTLYVMGPGVFNVEPNRGNATYIYSGPPQRAELAAANSSVTGMNFTVTEPNAQITVTTHRADGSALSNVWGWAQCMLKNAPPGPGNEFGNGINQGRTIIPVVVTGSTVFNCGVFIGPESGLLLRERKDVTVGIGSQAAVQLILVAPDARITGTVVDQNGAAVTGAQGVIEVNASQFVEGGGGDFGAGNFFPGRIDNNGQFSIAVSGGKKYNLGFWVRRDSPQASSFLNSPPNNAGFDVPVNGTVVRALQLWRANASVSGRLLDSSGNATNGWVFCGDWEVKKDVVKADTPESKIIETGTEVFNGNFTVPLVSGTSYNCGAGKPKAPSGTATQEMMPDFISVANVQAGEARTGAVLQFKRADSTINTTATFSDGSAPPFGWCWAYNEEGGNSGSELFNGTGSVPVTSGASEPWHIGCDSHNPSTGKFYRSEMKQVAVPTAGTYSQSFTLRESLFTVPDAVSNTFDCTAATTMSAEDGTILAIPANAIATEGNCTVTMTPKIDLYPDVANVPLKYGYDLQAVTNNQVVTGNFNSAVTLTIPGLTEEQMEDYGIEDPTDIIPKVYNETSGAWENADGWSYDGENYNVSMQHFTSVSLNSGVSSTAAAKNIIVSPKQGGGPQVTVWDSTGTRTASFMAYTTGFRSGVQAISADLDGDGDREIVTAPFAASAGHIRVFTETGTAVANLFPYGRGYRGTVSLAIGDVDGDGANELIIAPRHGGPNVLVYKFNGTTFTKYASFFAYHRALRGGIDIAAGDVNADGKDEIVATTNRGLAPQVRVLSGTGALVSQFFAYPQAFRGGVNAALADVDADGDQDIIVAARSDGGPQIGIFTGAGATIKRFFAYASRLRMGIDVAAGDVDGDGAVEIVTAPRSGGPHVKTFNVNGTQESQFMAYAASFRGGLELEVGDLDANGTAEIVVGVQQDGAPHIRVLNASGAKQFDFFALARGFKKGINLAISQ